jgi:hypothetical protein
MDNRPTGVVSFTPPWGGDRPTVLVMAAYLSRTPKQSVPLEVLRSAEKGVASASAGPHKAGGTSRDAANGLWKWSYDPKPTAADLAGCEPNTPGPRRYV